MSSTYSHSPGWQCGGRQLVLQAITRGQRGSPNSLEAGVRPLLQSSQFNPVSSMKPWHSIQKFFCKHGNIILFYWILITTVVITPLRCYLSVNPYICTIFSGRPSYFIHGASGTHTVKYVMIDRLKLVILASIHRMSLLLEPFPGEWKSLKITAQSKFSGTSDKTVELLLRRRHLSANSGA